MLEFCSFYGFSFSFSFFFFFVAENIHNLSIYCQKLLPVVLFRGSKCLYFIHVAGPDGRHAAVRGPVAPVPADPAGTDDGLRHPAGSPRYYFPWFYLMVLSANKTDLCV